MFERFTDQARRTVVLASESARAHNHEYLGIADLLLGQSFGKSLSTAERQARPSPPPMPPKSS